MRRQHSPKVWPPPGCQRYAMAGRQAGEPTQALHIGMRIGQRASGRLRGAQARQRDRLGLGVDQAGDAAEPIEQWRDRREAVIASVRMRAQARPCPAAVAPAAPVPG